MTKTFYDAQVPNHKKGTMMQAKRLLFLLGVGASMISTTPLVSEELTARQIMERVDARDECQILAQDMWMILIDKNGNKDIKDLNAYYTGFVEEGQQAQFFKSLIDVKNRGFSKEKDFSKENEQWLYLPLLKKVNKIPSNDKRSSFMGSDFSYFDMADRDLDDYGFKILKETRLKGHEVWMIESLPKNQEVIHQSGYKKSIAIVRKDNFMVVRVINFMTNGQKKYLNLSKIHQEDGVWLVDEITMTTTQGQETLHKTILSFNNIQFKRLSDTYSARTKSV